MNTVLRLLGYGWATLGGANIILFPDWASASSAHIGLLLGFNMLLFILPGLAVGGIGSMLQTRQAPASPTPERQAPHL
ncbi:MAG: hypothetical protein L0H63_11845 [Nitrococcus sp.]|nr:hypothetical protein [Nitrococcus sp.]